MPNLFIRKIKERNNIHPEILLDYLNRYILFEKQKILIWDQINSLS